MTAQADLTAVGPVLNQSGSATMRDMRQSAAVDRVVAILGFLAERPTESFSISELSRRLEISKATCHAMVGSLITTGWAMRNPNDMLVRVGPALIAAGARTAGRSKQLADLVRPDMERLARTYTCQGLASVDIGSEIVVIDTYELANGAGMPVYVGQRMPLRPPHGFVYLAWGNNRLDGREEFDKPEYAEVMSVIRQRGFSVALEFDLSPNVKRALREVNPGAVDVEIDSVLVELLSSIRMVDHYALTIEDDHEYNVSNISVPALDHDRNVVLMLSLTGFLSNLKGSQIISVANDLIIVASRLTGVSVFEGVS